MKGKTRKINKVTKFNKLLTSEQSQELLRCYCTKDMVEGGQTIPVGTLVWAKMTGSIYWPAIIADLEDKPSSGPGDDVYDQFEPNGCALVVFLEDKFRFYAINWERVIPVLETAVEEQKDLVIKLNVVGTKRPNCCNTSGFKRALEYLKEFVLCEPENRYKTAQSKFFEVNRPKSGRRSRASNESSVRSSKSSVGGKVTLEWGSEVSKLADQFMNGCRDTPSPSWFNGSVSSKRSSPNPSSESSKDSTRGRKRGASIVPDLKKIDEPSRKHGRYSLRPPPVLQPLPQIVEPEPVIPTIEVPTATTLNENLEDSNKVLKQLRPKGGHGLLEWATERFEELDKNFRLEPQKDTLCSAPQCGQQIKKTDAAAYCHELPFHEKCLTKVPGDGGGKKLKCQMCIENKCFICGIAENSPVKCSKCELRYHINCLRPFPQAEIQSETGPITCPLHFCHTCIAEHQIMKKVRNYKVGKSSLRCIKCPTSYHRACVPASCLSSLMPLGLIICPRHQNFKPPGRPRRLGCFMCNRRLVGKGKPTVVNCIKCPLSYHLDCVVDRSTFEGNDDALKEYMGLFECEACFWGLYPLPGQAVWCQQASYSFWPARTLFPKEMAARSANKVAAEEFSVVYFGAKPSYYDQARYTRVVPLNIGAYDVLKKIKIYTDDPKLMTAYEEGTYVMDLVDSYRTKILQPPEPVYKKIERNVYRTVKPRAIHKKTQHNDMASCSCSEDKSRDKICQFASGCINRDIAIECGEKTCGDSSRCTNRMFSNYKSQPCFDKIVAFPTAKKGWGVRTNIPLKKGDFVIEYLGEVISKDLYQWRLNRKDPNDALYFLELDTNLYIDAEYMGNLSRLINHSCQPNCCTEKYISQGKQVVGIFANCDIRPGAELTFDYDYEISGKPFTCACGASNCRGQINRNHIRNNQVGGSGMNSNESPSQGRLDEEWNEECEICGYAGNVLCCEAPKCSNAYHATCLGLNSVPSGTWICPRHDDAQGGKSKKKKKNTNGEKKLARLATPKRNDKENVQGKRASKKARPNNNKKDGKMMKDGKQQRQSKKKPRKDTTTPSMDNETDQNASILLA